MKEKSSKVNLFVLLCDVYKNFILIVMAAIIGFLSITVYAQNIRAPEYTASSTLVVSAKSTTYANAYAALSTASSMAGVLKEVFESKILLEKVEEDIGVISSDTTITANVISGTNLLVLNVTSKDPKVAYSVCNSVLDHYNDISEYLFSNAVLEVVAEPQIPTKSSNVFRINLFRLLFSAGSAVIVGVLIVFFCVSRKTIKNVKDIENDIDGEFLGVIPHEKKSKTLKTYFKKVRKACLINEPLCSFNFEQSNNRFAQNLQFILEEKKYKSILISSVAENEGKSTISANLSIVLGSLDKKVLIIDVDFRKPALYKIFNITNDFKKNDLVSYIDGKCSAESVIIRDIFQNVDVAVNFGTKKKSSDYILSDKLRDFVEAAKENYDYIIMDSSPIAVGTDVQLISDIAESTVIVVHQDYVRIPDIVEAIDEIKEGKAEYIGFVVNDYKDFNNNMLSRKKYHYGSSNYYNYNFESEKNKLRTDYE